MNDFDLSFNLIKGIALRNVGLDVVIYAKPKGFFKKYSKALEFSMTLDIPEIDVHIQELVVNTHIGEAKVSNAFLMDSKIGKIVRNNWDQFFESLINFQLNEVNVNNKQFDIKTLDPQIDLTSGKFPNSTVAFSYQEEFMYIGLKFFNDD